MSKLIYDHIYTPNLIQITISAFDKIFFGNLAAFMLEWLLVRLDTQKLRKLVMHNAYLSICVLFGQSKLDNYDYFYNLDVLVFRHFCLW